MMAAMRNAALVIPRWVYDPDREADRMMGESIWSKVNPSLRKLTNLLEIASQTARALNTPAITQACIERGVPVADDARGSPPRAEEARAERREGKGQT
jgi:hypothetical protein